MIIFLQKEEWGKIMFFDFINLFNEINSIELKIENYVLNNYNVQRGPKVFLDPFTQIREYFLKIE